MLGWISGGVGALIAVATMIVALLKVRPEIKKLKSDGGAALVTAATASAAEMFDQIGDLRKEVSKLWDSQRLMYQRLNDHSVWDDKVLRAHPELGPVPSLYPEPENA